MRIAHTHTHTHTHAHTHTHTYPGLVIGLDGPSEVRVEEGESVEVTVRMLEGSLAEDTVLLVGLSAVSGTARGVHIT